MELILDLWHLAFANLIQRFAPPSFEIQTEVRLTIEPQRADMILLRRIGVARDDEKAGVLRTLWPRLGRVTILEYKSPVDSSFRPGDLLRLWGYGVLYDTTHLDELPSPEDLTLVLVIASITPTLLAEIARMRWTLTPLGGGYGRIDGAVYTVFVVVTDEVTETERDEYLRLFSHRRVEPGEATRWLRQWMRDTKMKQPDIEELPGFEELFQKSIKKALEKMPVEERLAGLEPESLAPVLPIQILRGMTEEYIGSLPAEVQAQIRKRLRDDSH